MAEGNTVRANNNSVGTKKQAKAMSRKEKHFLIAVSILLVIAIAFVSVFLLYPRLAGRPDWQIMLSLDFDDSAWIKDMVHNRIKPTGKALDISSSFVYSEDTAYITSVYASVTTIEDAKAYYLNQIPGSVDYEAEQAARLSIAGELRGEKIDIINYQADLFNAYDTKVVIDKDKADKIKQKLIEEFPADVIESLPELGPVLENKKLGGYIMYNDDELSNYSYAGIPIFSVAYRYGGSKEELVLIQKNIEEKYADSILFDDGETVYFKEKGHIISLSISESDMNILAVVTLQEIPGSAR